MECQCWINGVKCTRKAMVDLYAPDDKKVPGCNYCKDCASRTITEYKQKLGENWTMKGTK